MEHTESSIKIFYTKDHTIFKSITGNRLLNERKINKIIADIKSGLDFLKYYPILVDENMRVVDGQHRLYVARKLKINIYYIISKTEIELVNIAKMNSNQEGWKNKDFINCFVVNKNSSYEILQNFMDKWKIPLSTAQYLLMYGTAGGDGGNDMKGVFQSGKFRASFEKEANNVGEKMSMFCNFPKYRTRTFIVALDKIILAKKCDFEILVKNYKENSHMLKIQADHKGYMEILQDIYNIGKSDFVRIY